MRSAMVAARRFTSFSLMLRRQRRSTLFPYTTLFRSRDLEGRVVVLDVAFASDASGGGFEKITRPLDRKSTRLNSSHVAISYAVFCLKKKILPEILPTERLVKANVTIELLTLVANMLG